MSQAEGVVRLSAVRRRVSVAAVPLGVGAVLLASVLAMGAVPPVPVPPQNPITEEKRVLGKILFFDEQVSTDNAVSCATCHVMGRAGSDPRQARNPGPDGVPNTPDDRLASPGVTRADPNNEFFRDPIFGLNRQITGRAANSPINAAYAIDAFWDGRARTRFDDPQTGAVVIPQGGGLESQAVGPPMNSVEMAHDDMNWPELIEKLRRVRPLELATNLPPDVAAALADRPTYPELFRRAFGDGEISARRFAFALATYQRTLISDQAPLHRFLDGDTGALTPGQNAGRQTFIANCAACHTVNNGLLTDQSFRNIGLRPVAEDPGRQLVTGQSADRGRFKVPSLLNVGLRTSFMHNGQFAALVDVVRFYARAPGAPPQFPDNRDPAMGAINFPPEAEPALIDFLTNALRDPRVASQAFPFDRATLFTQRPAHVPSLVPGGVPGDGGIVPRVVVNDPAMLGNLDFRIGLDRALAGATAFLGVSTSPPVDGRITPARFIGPVNASPDGIATLRWPLSPGEAANGQVLFVQWFVDDPAAPGGRALSNIGRLPIFCGHYGCPSECGPADVNNDGQVDFFDYLDFIAAFASGSLNADFNRDGQADFFDYLDFVAAFAEGCE